MSSQVLLSGGDKWYSYSGVLFGDVTTPATIQMILIPNTGLKDSYVIMQPYFGQPVTASANTGLGIMVKLDDVEIYKTQAEEQTSRQEQIVSNQITLFVPRQSKLEIISLNTSGNNTQERGVNVIGYYL